MEEYEYSIRVNDIQPFIEYCKSNGYKKISENKQNRAVYEHRDNRHILARITKTETDGKTVTIFDCKNSSAEIDGLKIAKESKELELDDRTEDIIKSMINVLNFEQSADNYRIRYVYKLNDVKFEIDDYIKPQFKVVAIEGEKNQVDKVYQEIINNKTLTKHIVTEY
ncbi:MAG TPA: hypothetical protein DD621_00840 [Clostridiales bacterium]|nr:hypothetical protein [Clostridiales bacterium]